uniref:Uncharacterized protein n=1 Tax=Anguilla anguilla TaxID=7936 RepID=A0A0E9UTY0_ANGAN
MFSMELVPFSAHSAVHVKTFQYRNKMSLFSVP